MEKIHEMVKTTMDLVGQTVRPIPSVPTKEEMQLRLNLEFEELREKAQAMGLEGTFGAICLKGSLQTMKENAHRSNDFGSTRMKLAELAIMQDIFAEAYPLLFDTNKVDIVGVFDAALDQRVVAAGTDLCFGLQDAIPEGDKEVFRSNMSKFDTDEETAMKGVDAYQAGNHPHGVQQPLDCFLEPRENHYIIKRRGGKYLKSLNYSPANLQPIIEKYLNGNS